MVWLPALEVHETRQRHSLLWHVLSAQDWWMFLGHKGPTEGNMFGFCVSTVWAKILRLNGLERSGLWSLPRFLLQRRYNWSWRRLALVYRWWFASEHHTDCPDRFGFHLSVYPTREEEDGTLGSNIISLKSSNNLLCLQHGKLAC